MADEQAARSASAFPPPSTSLVLLLQLSLGAAAMFAVSLYTVAFDVWRAPNHACLQLSRNAGDPDSSITTLVDCTDSVLRWQGVTALAAPLALLLLTVAGAALCPGWLTHQARVTVRPLKPTEARVVSQLAADAGLAREPLWCNASRSFAYGRPGRYRVALTPAVWRFLGRPRRLEAQALIRHELGHLVNGDIGRTYRAGVALGLFLVVFAIPVAVLAATRPQPVANELSARFFALAVIGVLVWLAVVRTREHDADLRAATWDAGSTLGVVRAARQRNRFWPWWLRTHPTHARRLRVLQHPAESIRLSIVECAVTGLAAGVAVVEIAAAMADLTAGSAWAGIVLSCLVVGVVMSGAVGVGVWRSVRVGQASLGRVLAYDVALAVGLVAGSQLSPHAGPSLVSLFFTASGPQPAADLATASRETAISLVAVLILLCAAILAWFAGTARLWSPRSRKRLAIGVTTGTLVLTGPLAYWFLLLRFAAGNASRTRSPVRPSLARRPRVERERFGFTLGFAPRSYPRRTPGRERSRGHWTGSHPHRSTLQSA